MAELNSKQKIAKRIALMFQDGELANLGVGIPTQVPAFIPDGIEVWLQA